MNRYFFLLGLLFLGLCHGLCDEFCFGQILVDNLNVRVQPSLSQTVVAKFAKGEKVKIYSIKDEWCEVEVPQDANVWIAAKDVSEDGEVIRATLLRCGPDITYSPYSRAATKGERLEVIEKREHWVKVKPPLGLTAWVSKRFVEISDEELKKLPSEKE